MIINTGERPGVYSSYEASSLVSRSPGGRSVGIAAVAAAGTKGAVATFTGMAAAQQALGADTGVAHAVQLVELALKNGARSVVFVAVEIGKAGTTADYKSAFAALENQDVGVVICDSDTQEVQQALRDSVVAASAARRERVAVMAMAGTATVLVTRAAQLANERAVLVGPMPGTGEGTTMYPHAIAASFAGLLAGTADPSLPLSGATLSGLSGMSATLADGDVDILVRGGVTPIECIAGEVSVVRAVTTRIKTGGVDDATWRELSTVLIADDVLSTLRNALKARFARAKNLPETREAVRTQATVELDAKRAAGIIAGYGDVTAEQSDADPTRCDVTFEFAVSHGMNQIVVGAHILV